MKRNLNKLTLLLLILVANLSTKAQSGFIGKKHEFSFDIYNAIGRGQHEITYKYSFKKRTSLLCNLAYIRAHINSPSAKSINTIGSSINNYIPDATSKGIKVGIGILWNTKLAAMNMPIGYYTGFSIDYFNGSLTNTIAVNQVNLNTLGYYIFLNPSVIEFPFKVKGYNFNYILGKNIYLTKNITLDILTKIGFGYYQFTPTRFSHFNYYNTNKYYTVKNAADNMDYSKSEGFVLMPELAPRGRINILESTSTLEKELLYSNFNNSSTNQIYLNTPTFNKFRLILYPQIKIGYLF